jgi:hypothetical protein
MSLDEEFEQEITEKITLDEVIDILFKEFDENNLKFEIKTI